MINWYKLNRLQKKSNMSESIKNLVTKIVDHVNKTRNTDVTVDELLELCDEKSELSNIKVNEVAACSWIFERGKRQGQRCDKVAESPIPYCKDCKKKKRAIKAMKKMGLVLTDNTTKIMLPARAKNELRKTITSQIKLEPTKYVSYSYAIPNHPEYQKEQKNNFVIRIMMNKERYAEAVFDDDTKTVRALTESEIKLAGMDGFLVAKDKNNIDSDALEKMLYTDVKNNVISFCDGSSSLDDALSSFRDEVDKLETLNNCINDN